MKGSLGFCVLAAIHWLSITADGSAGRFVPSDGTCGPPPVIPHGILCGVRAAAPQGSVVTYQCDSGYALIGPEERRCESGRWSGREPRCVCGQSGAGRYRRIVNGRNSRRNEHPWQAMVAIRRPDGQFHADCAATLISEQWLTTAAHCFVRPGSTNHLSEDNLKVYLGKYHRDINRDDQFVQEFTVSEIRVHPNYDNELLDSDIALIKLSRPAYLSDRVMPVCLAENSVEGVNLTETLIRPGSLVTVAGWGETDAGTNADILQTARLMTINNTQCENNYVSSGLPVEVTTNHFCAGSDDGHRDTCFGDNGGAVIAPAGRGGDRRWYLVGVTSWGSPIGCGVHLQYSGFTRVSKFLNFISSVARR